MRRWNKHSFYWWWNSNSNDAKPLLGEVFLDKNGIILKKGDKIILELIGLGIGDAEIVMHENELHIYHKTQGYYPLKHAITNDQMRIEKVF